VASVLICGSNSDLPRKETRTPTDAAYLRNLFSESAWYYERVNMLTSLGQVVRWRGEAIRAARLRPADQVLDAFSGPGSLGERAYPCLGGRGRLVLVDLSPPMLRQAKTRIDERAGDHEGPRPTVEYVAGDLLEDDLGLLGFDVVLSGWGLRYVPDVSVALSQLHRFLRANGRLVLLEFTRPRPISWATPAHYYFRHVLPRLGSRLARDRELHEYLRISAAGFLSREELEGAVQEAGFSIIYHRTYLDGLVTILTAVAVPTVAEGASVSSSDRHSPNTDH
jgi:demethylmenaquinone methyltransferase/2-methoxy-6-polyprenyl-1,4-benzoquinol methylase